MSHLKNYDPAERRRVADRRSSVAGATTTSTTITNAGSPSETFKAISSKDIKRPLNAVLSEDHLSGSCGSVAYVPRANNSSVQKQSFLSKFSREIKPSKSVDKSTCPNKANDISCSLDKPTTSKAATVNDEISLSKETKVAPIDVIEVEVEGDKIDSTNKNMKSRGMLGRALFPVKVGTSKSFCESDASELNKTLASKTIKKNLLQQSTSDNLDKNDNYIGEAHGAVINDDDENNQVLPTWPSRIDAASLGPSMVQVYSLKDYSQVSGPTENVTSSTAYGRLMKSMSQDRKVDSRTKRMSESILTNVSHGTPFYQNMTDTKNLQRETRQQRLPSMIGKVSAVNLSTIGPATSVNSLLPQGKNSTLISESRIDRMRKLFVSPLLSRAGAGAKPTSQAHQAPNQSRIGLQAGSNMLNKPHHIMHAMYRTRVAPGVHHNRRSPMRQKPGSIKSFRVYGCPLSMANTIYPITCFGRPDIYKQQAVPYILARLCYYIEENSSKLTHEGIFRVSGNARLMEKLKTLFDHLGDAPLESESVDVATSASMLKMYLRELPDPLIPTRMNYYFFTLAKKYSSLLSKSNFNEFKTSDTITSTAGTLVHESSSISDGQSTLDRQKTAFMRDLTKLIRKLPIDNYNLLKYLACFLHRISLKQHSNKMSAEALGIVFGPNVFRIRSESYKGLKEQELSNQIMASIISNYKQIFDCELTDPLGNLIKNDDFIHLNHEQNLMNLSSREGSLLKNSDHIASSLVSKDESINDPSCVPTTSGNLGYDQHDNTICPKYSHQTRYHYNDDDDERSDNDIEDSDEDLEDEECDEDSFSQTSDSGSYCSSLASDSEDSIYEGDAEQYGDQDDEFAPGSESSSECDSETSYTPSSSHTDTNENDAELSSSFSSVHSLAEQDLHFKETDPSIPPKSCLVCKRRESAQIEANAIKDQLRSTTSNSREGKKSKALNVRQSNIVSVEPAVDEVLKESNVRENQLANFKDPIRVSTRRKRNHDELKKITTSSDFTLDSKVVAKSTLGEPTNRHSNHQQAKQDHKYNLLRRRSSSTSSLLRITNKHNFSSSKKSGKEDHHHHHNHHHHHRARVQSVRRRYNDLRSSNRKLRNKGRVTRKESQNMGPFNDSVQRYEEVSGFKSHLEWKKGDYYVPKLLALNLSPKTRGEVACANISSSFLDVPDADHFFQLRSYNSDETLLRSQDFVQSSPLGLTYRTRRRFSGQDFSVTNHDSILANLCPEFSRIFETYEDECNLDGKKENPVESVQRKLGLSATGTVEASVVSLLSDQMVDYRHSTLSLNENFALDPIIGQLKAIKDLIKTLEKLIKNSSKSMSVDISNYLFQLLNDTSRLDSSDNISMCCDFLSCKNIILTLENLKQETSNLQKLDPTTLDKLIDLVYIRTNELKKRYNNIKYIREHYHKHHKKNQKLVQKYPVDDFKHSEKSSNFQQDGQSVCSDISSLGSALNTITVDSGNIDISQTISHNHPVDPPYVNTCKFGSLCPVEFVFNIEKRLASRRQTGARMVRLRDMTLAQLQSEKLELQKNLLRYEHWFGRPTTRSEFNLVGHLYDRYRAVKIIKQQHQSVE